MAVYGILLGLCFRPLFLSYLAYLNTAANVETMDLSATTLSASKPNMAFAVLLTIAWLFSIVDAYLTAKKYRRQAIQEGGFIL